MSKNQITNICFYYKFIVYLNLKFELKQCLTKLVHIFIQFAPKWFYLKIVLPYVFLVEKFDRLSVDDDDGCRSQCVKQQVDNCVSTKSLLHSHAGRYYSTKHSAQRFTGPVAFYICLSVGQQFDAFEIVKMFGVSKIVFLCHVYKKEVKFFQIF